MNDTTLLMAACVRSGDETGFLHQLVAGGDARVVLPPEDDGAGGCTLLGLAAVLGHHHLVSPLVSAGVTVDDPGLNTRTPLHIAAVHGHLDFARALLKAGANIEAASAEDDGERPLHLACRWGQESLVTLLVQEGADIEASDNNGWGPLHCASYVGNAQVASTLIRSGANIEASVGLWRPLHRAALWGHVNVIKVLLDAGANIEAQSSFGNRAIHYAASRGQIPVLELLESRGCDLQAVERLGGNALHSAASGGRLRTVQWLVGRSVCHRAQNTDGRTAEDMAQLYGQHHVAWWLHKQLSHPAPSEHTQTEASQVEYERIGNITLKWAKTGNSANLSAHLPSRPYRIHYQDARGWTPLHHAAYRGQQDAVLALLSVGAYPHALTHASETPGDLARSQGHTHIAQMLHANTPDLSRRQRVHLYGRLLEKVSCVELEASAVVGDTEEYSRRVSSVKEVTRLLVSGAPLEPTAGHTVFVLHLAITTNCTDLLPLLLSAGAPLTSTTGGMNILQLAWLSPDVTTQIAAIVTRALVHRIKFELNLMEVGSEAEDEELSVGLGFLLEELQGSEPWRAAWRSKKRDSVPLTKLLVKACQRGATLTAAFIQQGGGSVTSRTSDGRTALHTSLDADHMHTTLSLVRHMGANIFLCDDKGRLPLQLCPQETGNQLLEDAMSQDYRALDFVMEKTRNGLEKQNIACVIVLMAVLYCEYSLSSCEENLSSDRPILSNEADLLAGKTSLSCAAISSPNQTSTSDGWKKLFLHMITILRKIEKTKFTNDDWLKQLLFYQSQINGESDEGNGTVMVTATETQEELDIEEELFFLFIDRLKERGKPILTNSKQNSELEEHVNSTYHKALRLCCESGLPLLTHLLLEVAGVPVDEVVDPVSGSTALHIVASLGCLGLLEYLLSRHASHTARDGAGRTPAHLAYLFGHAAVGDRLREGLEDTRSKAGNRPEDLLAAFNSYMETYILEKSIRITAQEQNDPLSLIKAHLKQFKWKWRANFERAARKLRVDFTSGEAREVQLTLTSELRKIVSNLASLNPLLEGDLQVLGSSADNLRLYAPDEFDCNVVLKNINGFPGGGVNIELTPLPQEVAVMKGYTTCLSVSAVNESLKAFVDGMNFVNIFSDAVYKCVKNFKLSDNRLSFVTPGIRKTQVGVNISFAWEGTEFPLLLIDVDVVPVLKVPWPDKLERPPLTPVDIDTVHISNTGDGDWRYSFAVVENRIFRSMSEDRRLVFLACKLLIVTLKVESWAPRDVKDLYTYWNGRRFKIPAPAGFILKNAFLLEMEDINDDAEWEPQHIRKRMFSIFRRMCVQDDDVTSGKTQYFHGKVWTPSHHHKPSIIPCRSGPLHTTTSPASSRAGLDPFTPPQTQHHPNISMSVI
ncbi:serine/threonine-protein phosphatase 6 regulatory ankyrin repeat subunit C isoform X1 [Procambarus clarkii]|uniref:serine/threonine-protein phosphatase 6 regulatory ankyrin repeat subunit C isoform X1 n=1 Tax=Procambarus clarkii TaxID=6728 RepID=UPI003743DC3B